MFIELVDTLRCPRDHEDTWLVAAVEVLHGRHIARGSLGCPVCKTQYPVVNGAVDFTGALKELASEAGMLVAVFSAEEIFRLRALLDLGEPGGVVLLTGSAAPLVAALEASVQVSWLVANPTGISAQPGVSTVWIGDRVPVSPGSLRGAVVGDLVSDGLLASVVLALRPRGRLVAPADVAVPVNVLELARDDRQWVGERTGGRISAPVQLHRA